MPASYARRRGAGRSGRAGRGGRGRGEGCDTTLTQQTQCGASTSQAAMLDGLSSPGFQQMINDILLEGDGGYRHDTEFDGSQVHLDPNEPVSGPSHVFMALGGTPPSAAHVPGGSWEVSFMEPARLPTSPVSPAPAEQPEDPAPRRRARRASRRRGCGTRGHM
ncbi:hypothetical protein PIB30_011645 [Stylosanthes scabra]|uniref:Uncharacterized protein n=1 Tax=Stylosanthes scabra TaxID=79078 RepID=A0ABU6W5I9_9FABA|nr:hypothetical protein [Stylosanthes scabra]